jgi:prephenate dehydratase
VPQHHPQARHQADHCGDTAGAARIVSERNDKSCAAIAPRLAAEIYGLDILAEDIEDEKPQQRAVILAREPVWAAEKRPARW